MTGRLYSRSQVQAHKSRNDVWIIVHGKVYDVTLFLSEHPGGEDILLEYAGKFHRPY
jgi:cytochrome b involved in lipid metabolism